MKLQTQIRFTPEANQINYDSAVILVGSCFTEHIGEKLEYYKFRNDRNPFGIIFHPLALERLIKRAIRSIDFTQEDIFEQGGNWHCMEVHSLLSHLDKQEYLQLLNDTLASFRNSLENATHVMITLGTAWGYRYNRSDEIVANCHKIPQSEFSKELLSVSEVSASCRNMIRMIRDLNANATIVFTVSPVRHLKDGFVENMRSKAHLVSGIHSVLDEENLNSYYFPSYEIMMDELRDYRFYAEDMLHPNSTAIDIIWDRFSGVWIDPATESVRKEIATVQSGLAHRPFHPESPENKAFQEKLQKKIEEIRGRFPHIRF